MKKTKAFAALSFLMLIMTNTFTAEETAVSEQAYTDDAQYEDVFFSEDESTSEISDDEMSDFDDLFSDVEDNNDAEETAPVIKQETSAASSVITFNGSISIKAGALCFPYSGVDAGSETKVNNATPLASMESYFGFTARPSSSLSVKGKFYLCFPDFDVADSFYSLYADYTMFDKVFLSIGRTRTEWGNSFIFDTNILDDKKSDSSKTYSTSSNSKTYGKDTYLFINGDSNSSSSDFFITATVPFNKGQFTGVVQYDSKGYSTLSAGYIDYAASIEYALFGFNTQLFAKKWSRNSKLEANDYGKNPAIGISTNGTIGDWNINAWSCFNFVPSLNTRLTYARFVAGVARYWTADPKMAVTAEYMFAYDAQDSSSISYENKLGVKYAWSHVAGTWFSPSCQFFMNIGECYGAVIPGITMSGIPGMNHAQFTITTPVFFGNQTVSYNGANITSASGKPAVILAAVLSLNASY